MRGWLASARPTRPRNPRGHGGNENDEKTERESLYARASFRGSVSRMARTCNGPHCVHRFHRTPHRWQSLRQRLCLRLRPSSSGSAFPSALLPAQLHLSISARDHSSPRQALLVLQLRSAPHALGDVAQTPPVARTTDPAPVTWGRTL